MLCLPHHICVATCWNIQPCCQWHHGRHELYAGGMPRYGKCCNTQSGAPHDGVIGSPGRPDDQQYLCKLPSDRDDLGSRHFNESHGRDKLHQLPCLHWQWLHAYQGQSRCDQSAMFNLPYHHGLVACQQSRWCYGSNQLRDGGLS